MFTSIIPQQYSFVPGPKYNPKDRHIYNENGLNKTKNSFTCGQRINFSKPLNKNPGPEYEMKGFCDRFKSSNKTISY